MPRRFAAHCPSFTCVLGALLLLGGFTARTDAQIAVAGVTASSTFFSYNVQNLINGSGLVGDLHSGDFRTKWMSDQTPTASLRFDLGAIFRVGDSKIWNYGGGCCGADRSTRDLAVSTSTDGVNFFSVGSAFTLVNPAGDPFAGEVISWTALDVRFIQFELLNNYGSQFIGLSEVQFFDANGTVVPEPSSLAMLLVGAGLLGVRMHRRRGTSA